MMNVKNPFKVQNGVLVFKALLGLMTLKYVSVKNKKSNYLKAALFLWLLFVFIYPVYSQKESVYFEQITVERGLSQSSVLSIAQDSMGFMWFGTKDGLSRYDSRQFEIYRYNPQDQSSISSSLNINALLTDSKGNLWVGTQNGLNKYLPESNSFIRFQYDPKQENTLSNNVIRCIYEDRENNIWIGTDSGLNKLVDGKYFERFISDPGKGIAHNIVKAIYQDQDHTMWIGTQNGLTTMVFKNNKYRFKTYLHQDNDINSLTANDINSITGDLNHNIWIGTHFKGLNLFDKTSSTFKHFTQQAGTGLSSNVIRKIKVLKNGKLWIATLNGINVFDPVNHKFTVYQYDPENPNSLNQNSIYDIHEDTGGSIWAGTYYGGVNVYHANVIPFKTYKHYSYKNSLSSNVISAIVEDAKGNLWIGTEAEGLNYYDRTSGHFTNYRSGTSKENFLSSNLIKAISIDKNGNVWIAAYEGGLDFYSPSTGAFRNYKLSASKYNSLSTNRITSLLNDKQGRFWIGSKNGLYKYNSKENTFESLLGSDKKNHLPAKSINSIFQDESGTIWISTGEGVFYLKRDTEVFSKIKLKNRKTLLNNINSIQQDSKGKIWFGSYNEGLVSYHSENQIVNIYTTAQGLPANNITGIVEDNEGYLWVSTDKGLAKLEAGYFKVYSRKDGLPGNVFNYNSYLKDSNGELFFGGYNGMVSFLPENIKLNKKEPQVVFTGLKLFNKDVNIDDDSKLLSKAISKTSKIVFSYDQNIFSIDFSVLNFIKSGKNKYAYKLEGFENEWNYTDIPTATFTNLSDGTYTLLVKGANNDGVWNKEEARLNIVIKPPFWRTWWAYLIYILLFAGVLFLLVRYLLIRALLKREHDIHQMKLDFFTHVSHEIRTPLTLILGPLEKIIQDTQENRPLNRQLLGINKNVKRLSRLMNELMDFRKVESGKMKLNLTNDNLVSFTKEIYLSFQHMAIQRKIDYQFISEEKFVDACFDKDQLEKVLFNLLSNAFKFVEDKGIITIKILKEEEEIKIKICDNGPGIPKESRTKIFTDFYQADNNKERKTGTGIGLALSKSIAKLHHGDLILEDETEETCFCLILKAGTKHFKKEDIKQNVNSENATIYALQSEIDVIIYAEELKTHNNEENKLSVLVVEDNLEIRNFLIQSLNSEYEILDAENGEIALKIATEKIPDIIISDVMMPVMDGFEFCRRIKTDERTSHIPVILLTARSSEIHELDGLKTGADVYLTKPFSMKKLQLTLSNLLMLQENMRKKFSQQLKLEPLNIIIESSDEEFLNKVLELLEKNITNTDFNVNQFASEIGMSTPVFYKKIKALTGLTVNNFVKSFRLKRAAQLLEQNAGTVYEISYLVGFNDAKYFSKEFRKQFGQSPTEYTAKLNQYS
jgi:ligand-binding sensor domain-containing protein/signal transduction histidine kinase/DNA-binding response OmpR family regulator